LPVATSSSNARADSVPKSNPREYFFKHTPRLLSQRHVQLVILQQTVSRYN
jgi:hypothetical protein